MEDINKGFNNIKNNFSSNTNSSDFPIIETINDPKSHNNLNENNTGAKKEEDGGIGEWFSKLTKCNFE